ncbi:MAG: aminotransferase, partial [Lachnospiraceae bacterium]|nr:aminotransferase [Lachnospiraceae bacterium]
MKTYTEMNKEELLTLKGELEKQYEDAKALHLALDMSRGKPAAAQLDLSMPMMSLLNENSVLKSENGMDCRNYGVLDGIPEAKQLMADMVGTKPENVIVYGNSSLNIMYDTIARSMIHGVLGNTP